MTQKQVGSDVLVSAGWLAEHLSDSGIVIAEVNTDLHAGYQQGHIPGAVGWNLHTDLEDSVKRDIPGIAQFEELMRRSGIGNDTTVIIYGDGNNRSATWGFWIMKHYRHKDVRLLNGGRTKWLADGLPLSTDVPTPSQTNYGAGAPDKTIRAMKEYVLDSLNSNSVKLLDTRTYGEYQGTAAVSAGAPQPPGIYRNGRIPGAIHIPWDDGATEDGTFKPVEELRRMYRDKGIAPENEVIAYCRLGVRASYSWFVLKHLLGYERVRNYDGSWTEWGNSVSVPIEVGSAS